VTQLGIFLTFDRDAMVVSSGNVAFRAFMIGHALAFALLVLALVALHVRTAHRGGWRRFAAFAAAAFGTMALGATCGSRRRDAAADGGRSAAADVARDRDLAGRLPVELHPVRHRVGGVSCLRR
jgi:hypothetical protein